MKRYYDVHSSQDLLSRGDAVWLFNPQRKKGLSPKLMKPWQGPYLVLKRINDLVYRTQLNPRAKAKIIHRNRLWRYRGDVPPNWLPDTQSEPSLTQGIESSPVQEELPGDSQAESAAANPDVSVDQDPADSSAGLRRSDRPRRPPVRFQPVLSRRKSPPGRGT